MEGVRCDPMFANALPIYVNSQRVTLFKKKLRKTPN